MNTVENRRRALDDMQGLSLLRTAYFHSQCPLEVVDLRSQPNSKCFSIYMWLLHMAVILKRSIAKLWSVVLTQIWWKVTGKLCLQNCLSIFQYLPLKDMSSAVQIVLMQLGSYDSLLHWSICTQVSMHSCTPLLLEASECQKISFKFIFIGTKLEVM